MGEPTPVADNTGADEFVTFDALTTYEEIAPPLTGGTKETDA
jgi:hypothetical protein